MGLNWKRIRIAKISSLSVLRKIPKLDLFQGILKNGTQPKKNENCKNEKFVERSDIMYNGDISFYSSRLRHH